MTDEIICPLCSAVMEEKTRELYHKNSTIANSSLFSPNVKWYQCPTSFIWVTCHKQIVITHHTIESSGMEHFYLPPFRVDNNQVNDTSSIFKLIKYDLNNLGNKVIVVDEPIELDIDEPSYIYDWQLVTKTSLIKPCSADKMLEKVKLLLNFL